MRKGWQTYKRSFEKGAIASSFKSPVLIKIKPGVAYISIITIVVKAVSIVCIGYLKKAYYRTIIAQFFF